MWRRTHSSDRAGANVEIEVLNFCNSTTGVVTLVTHVLIEVGPVGVFEQDG